MLLYLRFREERFHLWEFLESRHTEFGVEHIQPCEVTLDLVVHSGFKGAKLELSLETGSEKQTFMKAACQEEKHGEVQVISRALFALFLLSPAPPPLSQGYVWRTGNLFLFPVFTEPVESKQHGHAWMCA